MPRPLRLDPLVRLAALPLSASLLLLGLAPAESLAQTGPSGGSGAAAGSTAAATGGGLSVAEAREAADRILKAVQTGDAQLRYSQLSDELKAVSSPERVQATMQRHPRILSWTLLSVRGGLSSTTVEASLRTTDGPRDLFLVLNQRGQLAGYHLDLTDEKSSIVARNFVEALSKGQYVTARSFLTLPLQAELSPSSLQTKWLGLQRLTGSFVRVVRVVEAEKSDEGQLVLVNTQFNRLTDNLFVILNGNNEITGVDFPQDARIAR
jgi:hypothetical protein